MTDHHSSKEQWIQTEGAGLLVRPEYVSSASSAWFFPGTWNGAVVPVGSGGRGTAWFIQSQESWVLRWYARGGLVARLSRSSYLYTGSNAVRSVAEFRLINTLFEQGLPVPKPVGAYYELSRPPVYRAAIVTCRLMNARSLTDYLGCDNPELWEEVGRVVRRFHRFGVDHADLNCDNILVTDEGVFLIDFDRGRLRSNNGRWQRNNLSRLRRSVDKLTSGDTQAGLTNALWQALLEGYNNASAPAPGR